MDHPHVLSLQKNIVHFLVQCTIARSIWYQVLIESGFNNFKSHPEISLRECGRTL
jgi:hypothetical protein